MHLHLDREANKPPARDDVIVHLIALLAALWLAACAVIDPVSDPSLSPNEIVHLRVLINEYADLNELPRELVQKLAIRESTHRPSTRNGPYYSLFQILPATARSKEFSNQSKDLLNAKTDLKHAMEYLKAAYIVSEEDQD